MPDPIPDAEQLTVRFAQQLDELASDPLPASVQRAAERSLLNVLGTAIGAARHEGVDILVATAREVGGAPTHSAPGRREQVDALWACTITGFAAHVDDFDDTHLDTVIHPGAAVLGPALTAAAERRSSGAEALRAVAVGIEAQLRVGQAMSPWHYDDGWHITGTCGVIGAAVTAGLLLELSADQMANALGTAASQTLGQREAFGTMIKGFHPGKASANGLLAARLAAEGFTGPTDVFEDPRGYFRALSPGGVAIERMLDGLGERWELMANTFKPYPCGIVSHPAIDAGIELSTEVPRAQDVARIDARVHPLVLDLAGNRHPEDGLAARFSTPHGIVVGLLDGHVDLDSYTDARAVDTTVRELRERVRLIPDEDAGRDETVVTITLGDGREVSSHITHAQGSLARPLTDEELQDKVRSLIEPVLPGNTSAVIDAVGSLVEAPSIAALLSAITTTSETGR